MSAPTARRPRVVVVILQWRRVEETVACLQSLAGLDYDDFDVLVVDNHSADGSVERIRAGFPDVTVHENESNLGFAGGCNVGVRLAIADPRVDYVLLLNNDTSVSPDFLTRMVEAAAAPPRAVAVGAINLTPSGHTSSGGRIVWWTGRYVDVLDERPLEELARAPVIEVEALAGSSMLIAAAELREDDDLFDPRFFCVFEETDWCVRQRRLGRRLLLATGARLEHRVSATMGKPLQFYFRFRNRPFFMAKHARAAHWVTFLPYYVVEATLRIVGYALVGRRADAKGVALGVWDAARGVRGRGSLGRFV